MQVLIKALCVVCLVLPWPVALEELRAVPLGAAVLVCLRQMPIP